MAPLRERPSLRTEGKLLPDARPKRRRPVGLAGCVSPGRPATHIHAGLSRQPVDAEAAAIRMLEFTLIALGILGGAAVIGGEIGHGGGASKDFLWGRWEGGRPGKEGAGENGVI